MRNCVNVIRRRLYSKIAPIMALELRHLAGTMRLGCDRSWNENKSDFSKTDVRMEKLAGKSAGQWAVHDSTIGDNRRSFIADGECYAAVRQLDRGYDGCFSVLILLEECCVKMRVFRMGIVVCDIFHGSMLIDCVDSGFYFMMYLSVHFITAIKLRNCSKIKCLFKVCNGY